MIFGEVPKLISEPAKAMMLLSAYWPWYLNTETTGYDGEYSDSIQDELSGEDPQFLHTVLNNNQEMISPNAYEKVAEPIWKHIVANYDIPEFESFRRIKMNLLTKKESKHLYHTPHVDFELPHWTMIYYVNDSDGPTYFFKQKYNGERQKLEIDQIVEPRQGTFVLFDGLTYHASSNPKYHDYRSVINFNYI